MNTTEIVIFVGLAALIIGTQFGHRNLTLRRLIIPLAAVAYTALHYMTSIPTTGGDLDFEIILSLAGVALGVLAASFMRVELDKKTGRLVTQAGLAYAAVWVVAFGGRLAFAWAATHIWQHQIAQFSIQHEITSSAAWTAAFVLSALSMVVARTVVIAVRALLVSQAHSLQVATQA